MPCRQRLHGPPDAKRGGKIKKPKWDTELGRLLWLDGRKDGEIADEFGIATSVVTSYRKRHWEKGSQKPAPVAAEEINTPEHAPEEPKEVAIVEETKNPVLVNSVSAQADPVELEKRIGVLIGQRDAAEKQRDQWLDRCDQHLQRIEDLEARLAAEAERLKRMEASRDSFREENLLLRAQLDIVYLIFGSRHVGGLDADT